MERRMILAAVLSLTCSSALADESISVRPLTDDRLLIEDATGRDLGSARRLNDHMWVVEDMSGRDRIYLRDLNVESTCGDEREAITCLLGEDDEDDDD